MRAFSVFYSPSLLPDVSTSFYSLALPAWCLYTFEHVPTQVTFADFLGEVGWIVDSNVFATCQNAGEFFGALALDISSRFDPVIS